MLDDNKRFWDSKLHLATWIDRITRKISTEFSPFELLYGQEERTPNFFLLPVYRFIIIEQHEDIDLMDERIIALE